MCLERSGISLHFQLHHHHQHAGVLHSTGSALPIASSVFLSLCLNSVGSLQLVGTFVPDYN